MDLLLEAKTYSVDDALIHCYMANLTNPLETVPFLGGWDKGLVLLLYESNMGPRLY